MGLDMYLHAKKYLPGYTHSAPKERKLLSVLLESFGMEKAVDPHSPEAEISVCVGYWRKANAIHGWFIDNYADGADDCRPVYLERDALYKLRDVCLAVKENRDQAADLLPPTEGCFFGSTEIDAAYMQDIDDTVEILNRALAVTDATYEYRASW